MLAAVEKKCYIYIYKLYTYDSNQCTQYFCTHNNGMIVLLDQKHKMLLFNCSYHKVSYKLDMC